MYKYRLRFFLLVLSDAFLVNAGIVLSFLLRFGELRHSAFSGYQNSWFLVTLVIFISFSASGLYARQRSGYPANIFEDVVKGILIAIPLVFMCLYLFRTRAGTFPSSVLLISMGINLFLVFGAHFCLDRLFNWKLYRAALLTDKNLKYILSGIKKNLYHNSELVGVIHFSHLEIADEKVKDLGSVENLSAIIQNNRIDELIAVLSQAKHQYIPQIIRQCAELKVKLKIIPELYEIFLTTTSIEDTNGIPLITLSTGPISEFALLFKRIISILGSFILLLLFSPLLIICAILIKFTDGGSIIYTQARVGKDGKIFKLYKLRSMEKDAERHTGPILAEENDSRVTWIGKYMRRFRIDELPQLFNVLKGDMSLVGPRPERPEFVKKFIKEIPGYALRFQIRPGVTGLAQVHQGYHLSARNKLRYDLLYIRNYSVVLDLIILFQTIWVVLFQKGAR